MEDGHLALFCIDSDSELAAEYLHRFHFQGMRHSCPFLHCSVDTKNKQNIIGR